MVEFKRRFPLDLQVCFEVIFGRFSELNKKVNHQNGNEMMTSYRYDRYILCILTNTCTRIDDFIIVYAILRKLFESRVIEDQTHQQFYP